MTYFRQPKKKQAPQGSIDGFVTRNSTNSGKTTQMQSKFRTSYSPNGSVGSLAKKEDGFSSRQRSASLQDQPATSHDGAVLEPAAGVDTTLGRKSRRNRRAEKRALKKQKGTFKKVARGFSVIFIALVIGVSSLFAYGYIKTRNIFKGDGEGAAALQENVDPAKLNGEGDGRVNILMIGKGGPGYEAPDLTDTLLLASIDPVQNEASLVSVPRDMYVKDQNGYSTKINAIYSNAKRARLANSDQGGGDTEAAEVAGLNAVKDSVSEVLGVPVHYYIMVDFKSFEDAINTVGGITVDVQEPLYDQTVAWLLGGNPLVAAEGLQTFDGSRALLYARSRKGSARGDFDRTERQREIVVALQNKVLSLGTFSNPFKVAELLDNFGSGVRTDLNGLNEIKRLYEIGQDIGPDKIGSIGLADPPNVLVTTDFIGNQSVVVPTAGLYQYDEIHSYIRNNLRDAFLKSEDARVLILNGTDVTGLANATSKELKSYGYNVIGIDNAPTDNYVQNVLIDNTNGEMRYTKSYIERRLGLSSVSELPAGVPGIEEADFVIILGTDEVSKATN